jgi:hypothetical protein
MSFTQAMQAGGGQPGPQQPQQNPLVAEMHQTTQAVQALIQKLRQVPGIDQAMFQQGVQLMAQGTQMIAQAMPKQQPGGGGGPSAPGGGAPPPA